MANVAALGTREDKLRWLFQPFGWALYATALAIAPLFYWGKGDNPTGTIISLSLVILFQFVCTLWGMVRLRRATRGY